MVVSYKERISLFEPERLEALARVLADTSEGLSGPEIGHVLTQLQIPDVDPTNTKWKRLYNALASFQNEHEVGNHVVVFVTRAMDPARYTSYPGAFAKRRDALNPILALCGLTLGNDGKIRNTPKAATLDEALERANRFQTQLGQRNVHGDVLRYCTAEILTQNYFHAVFEAMKSVTVKIRKLAGVGTDGQRLVDDAFGFGKSGTPVVAINTLETETQRGEQRGFSSLLKGLYGMFRNPLAHDPKIDWDMSEQDALDIMGMISLVHRKLDSATRTQPARGTL